MTGAIVWAGRLGARRAGPSVVARARARQLVARAVQAPRRAPLAVFNITIEGPAGKAVALVAVVGAAAGADARWIGMEGVPTKGPFEGGGRATAKSPINKADFAMALLPALIGPAPPAGALLPRIRIRVTEEPWHQSRDSVCCFFLPRWHGGLVANHTLRTIFPSPRRHH